LLKTNVITIINNLKQSRFYNGSSYARRTMFLRTLESDAHVDVDVEVLFAFLIADKFMKNKITF